MKKTSIIYLFCFLLISNILSGQINNSVFENSQKDSVFSEKTLSFSFQYLGFLQNREYFSKIADGFTLIGNQLNTKFIYKPAKEVEIGLGGFFWKDFGNEKFSKIQPTFFLKVSKKFTELRFGNLNSNLNHQLIEPLFNFERLITNNLENGLQVTKNKNGNFFDFWIDWQKMAYFGSPYKEEIWGGINWKPIVYQNKNIEIKTPIQVTLKHRGGQIVTDSSALNTYFNSAIGLEIKVKQLGIINNLKFQNYWLNFKNQTNANELYKSGSGVYLNASLESNYFNTMVSYFKGKSFYSPTGGDLFQYNNKNRPKNVEKDRQLVIIRLYKDFKIIDNLYITARFEPYYDINNQTFEHSEGIFINYKDSFSIFKKNK